MRRDETGQSTVEWSALVLLVVLVLAGFGYAASRLEGKLHGDGLIEAIVCAIGGGCSAGVLEDTYGNQLARTLRRYVPNVVYERRSAELPVDFRRCRTVGCSNGADRAAPIRESDAGMPVTAFTHVVDSRGASGNLYLQFWFYYPESFSGGLGRALGPLSDRWPGFHPDDWEGYQVRIAPGDHVSARATAHGKYKNFKHSDGWGPWTGWYRVSGGSHAGHLVSGPTGERSTNASSVHLVPLESLQNTDVQHFEVSPPWQKTVYREPESGGS
jgi:hypothetical protein